MSIGYQQRDFDVIDYQLFALPSCQGKRVFQIRGPEPESLVTDRYFACLGAAFTFGCFSERPYGTLLQEALGIPTLNLGFAGAGPYYFLRFWNDLADYIKNARFVTILIMSGRSESNSFFDSGGTEVYRLRSDKRTLGAENAWRELLQREDSGVVREAVRETRETWIRNYQDLMVRIDKPKILLWLSERAPEYSENYENVHSLFGKFPQLVNREMIDRIKPNSDYYVECITKRGMPQPLVSRFTGEPTQVTGRADLGGKPRAYNSYYATPEMHQDAAIMLTPICREIPKQPTETP
jgi:hypothetical protein